MNFGELAKRAHRLITDNSPLILTAIGVTGTLTTAYLTGRATFKAAEILRDNESEYVPLTSKDKVDLCWKLYIPAAGTAAFTVMAIIFANRISTRRSAAVAAAFSISERAFEEYRTKVVEKIGEKKERAYRDEIAQERLDRDPVGSREIIITSAGDVLCYDSYTGRYFRSNMEAIRKAQNDVNEMVTHDHYASLTDFYDRIGLSSTQISDEVGWNLDKFLHINFSVGLSDDNTPCHVISYEVSPAGRHFRKL